MHEGDVTHDHQDVTHEQDRQVGWASGHSGGHHEQCCHQHGTGLLGSHSDRDEGESRVIVQRRAQRQPEAVESRSHEQTTCAATLCSWARCGQAE